ncbi:hypothetical protein KQI03_01945 [Levilactobacillus brevis]|uniref:hypothetical protein n=1 Tax=Levilactobacillus brevis TaxID=1580 RepID=UPI001C12677F|nr:hypothetical protein [Levilactobacillus brevis]MBU5273450.1 hypothetical protein [Levilactobacillus brevis]
MAVNQSGDKFVTLEKLPDRSHFQRRREVRLVKKVTQKSPSTATFDQTRKHFGWFRDGVANQVLILIILMVLVEAVHTVMEK